MNKKIKPILAGAIIMLVCSANGFAQKNELNKAKSNYSKFSELKGVGTPALGMENLKTAKTAIDKAVAHEKTSGLAETWLYAALVNADMALVDSAAAQGYIAVASEAVAKTKSLDEKKEHAQNLEIAERTLAQYELNRGVKAFEKQDYKGSYEAFNNGLKYMPGDTTFIYYAGLAAINAQDYDNAIARYKELAAIDSFSNQSQIYLDLSKLYVMKGDTAAGIKYIEEGVNRFPNNNDLATQNIELNLMTGNEEKVINTIKKQIEKDPQNKNLHFYLGIAYGAAKDNENAEAAYKKAVEIDPAYADAYVNLGGLILNRGIDVYNAANQLSSDKQKEYEEEVKKAQAIFDSALPYLQKAAELQPESRLSWQNLRTYYEIKENKEKVAEIDAKMKDL